jgi:uncharacterized damage-inducible protein DinB
VEYLTSMFHTISEFLKTWKAESEITLRTLRQLTDESLNQRVTPNGRSLGFIAWHITTTLGEMLGHQAKLPLSVATDKDPMPVSAAAIAEAYEGGAAAVAAAVKANWTDAHLADEIPMYGEKWAKGHILAALIAHQCHHRGQMTVLMRQAGLKVPGVYGPSQEEWASYGMAAQP